MRIDQRVSGRNYSQLALDVGGKIAEIGRANLDGSGVKQDFVALPRQHARRGLAVGDTHLYWTNPDASGLVGDIGRAKLDGTGADQSHDGQSDGHGNRQKDRLRR